MFTKSTLTYQNPLLQMPLADPFMLKTRGRYYLYATQGNTHPVPGEMVFPVLSSPDMIHWDETGRALSALEGEYFNYWAPEVTEYNGKFYLYYAVHLQTEFQAAIRVAVAERPEGPFIDSGHDLTSHLVSWAIDPHLVRAQDGYWYLFMTVEYLNDPSGFNGSGNAVARLRDPFTLEGELARVTAPAYSWELYEAQRAEKGGIDWYTVEAPYVARHRGRYYHLVAVIIKRTMR